MSHSATINSAVTSIGMGQLAPVARQVVAQPQPGGSAEVAHVTVGKQASSSPIPPVTPSANGVPSSDELKKLVSDMQSKVPEVSKELQFSVDQDSGKPVVTLTDRATKEVLWQLPSEVALRISRELDQFQKGTLVNRHA
jgi:flagellar protein FlaG